MAELPSVEASVEALSQAQTQAELVAGHAAVRRAIRAKRKAESLGPLARAYTEAVTLMDARKADGVPFAERVKGLEQVIRAFWPKGRDEPWRYVCDVCRDTGWVFHTCRSGQRCDGVSTRVDGPGGRSGQYRRLCAKHPESDYTHDYVVSCFCAQGRRRETPAAEPAHFAQAGKVKKSGFTKAGR